MSADFPGVVETSSSLGVAETAGDELTLHSLSRSANDGVMPDVLARSPPRPGSPAPRTRPAASTPAGGPTSSSPLLAAARTVHARARSAPSPR